MTGFNIRNQSNVANLQVFVSKYTNENGSDKWYQVPNDFASAAQYHWNRNGWELVAFKDLETGVRRGWYLNCGNDTVAITFAGFNQDLGIVRDASA
ncbi:hypothetical protein NLJ89_g3344 [Agrocybe chaxingu]|uniref:Uncharacterized protein n=1 Tax=Agrocybe chaxingu TaxID=84603 RepID=A0A9W8MYI7_9AGAR|nr:hypothetical protein NLJ89_g3344 [Agrocybe chaxingu]